jgi:hypothetical protein
LDGFKMMITPLTRKPAGWSFPIGLRSGLKPLLST